MLEQEIRVVRVVEIGIDVVLIAAAADERAANRGAKIEIVLLELDVYFGAGATPLRASLRRAFAVVGDVRVRGGQRAGVVRGLAGSSC